MRYRYLGLSLLLLTGSAAAQEYVISTFAGGGSLPTPIPALDAPIGNPTVLCVDAADNLYFITLDAVFKLDRAGVITRAAGNSRSGYLGDGGPAPEAQLRVGFNGLTARDGNLYIADAGNHRIRKVSPDGVIRTIAGNGIEGFSGDGGAATNAQLDAPSALAFDAAGNLFIADWGNGRVRKVSTDGVITTVAGLGKCCGSLEDGIDAKQAQLSLIAGLVVDNKGNLFIADSLQRRIRKVSADGTITTLADPDLPLRPDTIAVPSGITADSEGNLFINYFGVNLIRKVAADGTITTIAGGGDGSGDGTSALSVRLSYPLSAAVDSRGNLYIAESDNGIRKVSRDGSITTVAGGAFPFLVQDGQPATSALLALGGGDPAAIASVAVDGGGNLYIAETGRNRIRKVSPDGIITTIAGTGTPGYEGNNGPAATAQLNAPWGVAVDGTGNLFIADTGNNCVRKVSANGMISTVPATDSDRFLASVAVDGASNLFVAAWGYVRKISPDGAASIVAGGGLLSGAPRDGKPATQAAMFWLCGLAVDATGNLFIVDCNDNEGVIKVTPDGILHIIQLPGGGSPRGVAVDGAGNAFFPMSDSDGDLSGGAERVYKVSPDGSVTLIAGTGIYGYSGDGGPAKSAELGGPAGAAVDSAGSIYFADTGNGAVRVLRPAVKVGVQ